MRYIIIISLLFISTIEVISQKKISFSLGGEYWAHTNLVGVQFGVQIIKPVKNNYVFASIGFGYGENNGIKKYNLDSDIPSLLTYKGSFYKKEGGRNVTDDASQVKLSVGSKIPLYNEGKTYLYLVTSVFSSYVSHFYVVDVIEGYELSNDFNIDGPIHLVIMSHQTFYTGGVDLGMEYVINKEKNSYACFLKAGYGIRGTSYVGIGMNVGGIL